MPEPGDDALKKKYLPQLAAYWAPGPAGGGGEPTYTTPIAVPCRWTDDNQIFINMQGREARSRSMVNVDRDLDLDGVLLLLPRDGTIADVQFPNDPFRNKGALEIQGWKKVPDKKARKFWR